MTFTYFHLFLLAASVAESTYGFVTPFGTSRTAICTTPAFVSQSGLFSEEVTSTGDVAEATEPEVAVTSTGDVAEATEPEVAVEEVQASDDESTEPPKVPKEERHTLFLGNLPFGM